jgi:nicotinamidase-related amidase
MSDSLRFGPISSNARHVCVDMQRLFAEETPWKTSWMNRVLPKVVELVQHCPERTVFTRFIPARNAGEGKGAWARYWRRWESMTLDRIGEAMADLVPELARFVPPARTVDKRLYSPWVESDLESALGGADTLIVSGGETDVCVLATVLGAVDRGYRVIVVSDALCSTSDATHDASMTVYHERYGQQVETVRAATVLANWTD